MDKEKQESINSLEATSEDNGKVEDCKVYFYYNQSLISR